MLHILCPQHGCAREVTRTEVQARVQRQCFVQYARFYKLAKAKEDPNARLCPTPDCDGFVIVSSREKRVRCGDCSQEFCCRCNEPWHPGLSCAKAQDRLMLQHKREHHIFGCPSCGVPIFKHSGCAPAALRTCMLTWISSTLDVVAAGYVVATTYVGTGSPLGRTPVVHPRSCADYVRALWLPVLLHVPRPIHFGPLQQLAGLQRCACVAADRPVLCTDCQVHGRRLQASNTRLCPTRLQRPAASAGRDTL